MEKTKTLHHAGITVADLDRSLAFYEGDLGLRRLSEPSEVMDSPSLGPAIRVPEAALRVVQLGLDNLMLELLEYLRPASPIDRPAPPHAVGFQHIAFQVDDLDQEVERLEGRGVSFFSGINLGESEVLSGWRWIYCADPDDNPVELVEIGGPAANREAANGTEAGVADGG